MSKPQNVYVEGVIVLYPTNKLNGITLPEGCFIEVDDFEAMFGAIEAHEFSYNYLTQHQKITDAWKSIFEEWKEQGILN